MKLSIIAGLICTALAALAVACGGDDDTTGGTSATTTSEGTATTQDGDGNGEEPTETGDGNGDGNGSGTEDINEYFRDLAARFEFSRNDSDDATARFTEELDAATTLDEQKQVINDFLDAMIEVFDGAILTMNGFSVPEIAAEPHFTFRDDIVQAKAISETLKDDIEAAGTAAVARAVIDDFDVQVGALVNHAQAACRDLQDIADEQNIDEDLGCNPA